MSLDWRMIGNGLVPKMCVMGVLLGLDWNRIGFLIDIELQWVGSEFTPQGCGLDNPIGFGMTLDWHQIGLGLAMDLYWIDAHVMRIGIPLTSYWDGVDTGLISDWHKIGIRLAIVWHRIGLGLIHDCYKIDTGWYRNWTGSALYWRIGDEVWHWQSIGFRLTIDWHRSGTGLTSDWQ